MLIAHDGHEPRVHDSAWVAPNATVCGDVEIGPDSRVLFGAVVTAESGPVRIGSSCVVMEHAVLRGTRHHPLRLGDAVLVGPHAHLSGCTVDEGAFIATGAAVFNGAVVGSGSEVRINAVVHVATALGPDAVVPIGWIALGDPPVVLPPDRHEEIWEIQEGLDFPGRVFGSVRGRATTAEMTRRYAGGLARYRGSTERP